MNLLQLTKMRKREEGHMVSFFAKLCVIGVFITFSFSVLQSHAETIDGINADKAVESMESISYAMELLKIKAGGKTFSPVIAKNESPNANDFTITYGNNHESVRVDDKKLDFTLNPKGENHYIIKGNARKYEDDSSHRWDFISYDSETKKIKQDYNNPFSKFVKEMLS